MSKKQSQNRKNGFIIQTTAGGYDTGELLTLHEAWEKIKEIEKIDPYARLIQVVDHNEIYGYARTKPRKKKEESVTNNKQV